MKPFDWKSRPLRVAIVGSGPGGFFTAEALLKFETDVQIDIFEQLPAPYGLVRYGVSPDHPSIKKVIGRFDKIAQEKQVSYFGNVTIGKDISMDELRQFYDVIVLASGALIDNRLNIPGEDLPGSHPAMDLIGWLNGHPHYQNLHFDLSHETIAVIGQGNVALDLVRMLGKTTEELQDTDITQTALETFSKSKVKTIVVLGRRGPAQVSFSLKEIQEIQQLPDCNLLVDSDELELKAACLEELEQIDHAQQRRIHALLKEAENNQKRDASKKIILKFLLSPVEIAGSKSVEKIICEKNELTGSSGKQKARGTGEKVSIECGQVFRSIGFTAEPIKGVDFDKTKGIISHQEGRVLINDERCPGAYAVGWVERGSSGLIGTDKRDAVKVVTQIKEDLPNITPCTATDSTEVTKLLNKRNVRVVNFADWQKIDQTEIENGEKLGKPREKFCTTEEMLGCL